MRILLISILGLLTLASCTKQEPMEALIDRVFTVAEQQYTAMDTRLTEKTLPRTLSADGEFVSSNIYWWCSGFYPGSLWYIYEYTRQGRSENTGREEHAETRLYTIRDQGPRCRFPVELQLRQCFPADR